MPAPTVTGVSPYAGALAGGKAVTITGTGFMAGASVLFGGSACTGITVVNATTITCTTSAHSAGAVTVTVTNSDTQSGSAAAAYTYQPAPTVTSVSPTFGNPAGGTLVTITGTGFVAGASVDFGSSACTGITVLSATSITCTTPAHALGTVAVTVTNADTQSGSLASAYTYPPAPTVASVSPSVGSLSGGTTVTITGTGFLPGASVDFGGSACTGVTVISSFNIICTTPAHAAGAVTVTITNSDTQSGSQGVAYIYMASPSVTSVSPNAGALAGGTAVTITGSGFLPGATASFGGSNCSGLTVVNATTITCTTSSHAAGSIAVTVTNSDAQSGSAAGAYTYQAAPSVTSLSPNAGTPAGATSVTISGTGFLAGASVDIGGSACTGITVVNATTITCTTPAHAAGAVNVTVTNSDTQSGSAANAFTYQDAPTVTSASPNAGALAGATAITITGTGFLNGATVSLGGSPCNSVIVASSTQITCITTAHAAGAVTITVTNADTQNGSAAAAYTYQPAPTVTSVAANTGLPSGGTAVTITGTGFLTGATVDFGGSTCAGPNVVNATTITCTTTAHSAGAVAVQVTNTDGQYGITSSAFTYQSAAILSWVVGVASPTPPDPDDFGSTTTNITHTFTLTNTGDVPTSTISISKSGASPGAWMFGTDTCSGAGNELPPGGTCTVQLTFLGAFIPTGAYSANLQATATTGGTTSNAISAAVP